MLRKLWHKLFGHKFIEEWFQFPADAEQGRPVPLNTLFRRCSCGHVQAAQAWGFPMEVQQIAASKRGNDELEALRRMAGL